MVKNSIILKSYFILSLFIFISCFQSRKTDNLHNYYIVNIGDSEIEVVNHMKGQPDQIVYGDSIYLNQEIVINLINYVYYTPLYASHAKIYFKDCKVFHKHMD